MKVMAIFKQIDEDDLNQKSDNLWDYMVDGITDIWSLLTNVFKTGIEEKSIIIMPQYVTGFSLGKGFGVYKENLAGEVKKLSEYHGEKNIKLSDSEDCLITISGKIVSFDLKNFYDGVEEETKGGSLLNRQNLVSQILEYGLNIRVINSLSKWALDSHTEQQSKAEGGITAQKKLPVDVVMDKIQKGEKVNDEVIEQIQTSLSEIEIPEYKGIRKSLVLIMFKETDETAGMSDTEKAAVKEKEKLKRPGSEKMSFGNYLENMLDTVHYTPVRYMYFPEVELTNYKEVIKPSENTEGEYIIEVKRPGNSSYPISMADPASEILDELKKYGAVYWDVIVEFFKAGFGGAKSDVNKKF